jgi:DHA1 family bicyclomycin/chloramphenicol resistance-like MFS transporter
MDARAEQPLTGARDNSRALLFLLMAMTATGPVSLNILVPAMPQLAERLGSDIGTVQLTLSLFLFSLAVAQLVLGPLSDRFGRRPVVLGGLALATVASLAGIAASSIGWLIVARVVQAVGASTGLVVGRAVVRDLYERDRAAAMLGLVTTVMVIAPMLAPMIGGFLDTSFGWQSIFVFLCLFHLIVLIWAMRTLPETRPARAGMPGNLRRDWTALLKSPVFHGYVLCGAFGTAQFFIFIGGGPHVVVSMMGHSSAEYGLWFTLTSLGYMSGNFITSRYSQRLGIRTMILGGLAVQLAFALVEMAGMRLFPDAGPALIFVPQILISMGNGAMLPNAVAGAVSVVPQAAGAASGITGFAQMAVGAAAAQLITVALAGAATPLAMPLMTVAVIVIAGAAFLTLVRR